MCKFKIFLLVTIIILSPSFTKGVVSKLDNSAKEKEEVRLPLPQKRGNLYIEEAISQRRSVREYEDEPLIQEEVSQLLWAAQGITAEWGGRTVPSAGALYPLEIYLVAGKVKNLEPGIYHYNPNSHSLGRIVSGDRRFVLFNSGLWQSAIKEAPISLIICADYSRTTRKYGERGKRYVHIEVGHVAQNVYLQAESLGLATVAIGAFSDLGVKKVLRIKEDPFYIMPVGRPRKEVNHVNIKKDKRN